MTRWTWPQRLALVVMALFSIAFVARTSFVVDGRRTFSLFDDAMISMRYARNLAHGDGFGWNASGPPVEGYTNLLWTLWMAVLHLVPIPTRLISAVVALSGGALLVLNAALVRAIALRVSGSAVVATVSMWIVVAYYPLAYWTLRGMEVGLVATLTAAGVLLALRLAEAHSGRDLGLFVAVLAALVLTRTDVTVIATVIVAWLVLAVGPERRRQVALAGVGAIAVTLAAHTAFRIAYYGDPLPNTYYLKLTGISLGTRLGRGVGGLITMGSMELYAPVLLVLAYVVWRRRATEPAVVLLAAIFGIQCLYSAYVGGDAWEAALLANRYLAAAAPMVLVAAVTVVHRTLALQPHLRLRIAATAGAGIAGVVVIRAADWRPASGLQLGKLPTESLLPRVGLPILAAAAVVALARSGARASAVLVGVFVAIGLSVSARELSWWLRHNAFLTEDTNTARLGFALGSSTSPGTVVAFSAAGASAYFSDRPAVDLGGKSDSVIAHEPPKVSVFIPGHNKYDYAQSVLGQHPDVVIALGGSTAADLDDLRRWGYDLVAGRIYVRAGATGVDRERLAAAGPYS